MEATPFIVAFSVMITLMFFVLGGLIGWNAKQYLDTKIFKLPYNIHPECLDENGEFIPDKIVSLRVDNYGDYYENLDYEEDDDNDD